MPRRIPARLAVALLLILVSATPASVAATVPPRVTRYAPLLYLVRTERSGPMAVEPFLAHAELKWARVGPDALIAPKGKVDASRLGAQCATAQGGCYRYRGFLASDHTRPHDAGAPPSGGKGFYLNAADAWVRNDRGEAPLVYYDVRGTAITYWFFYRDSVPFIASKPSLGRHLSHEGDWERVDVVLSPAGAPTGVRFHQHAGAQLVPWRDVCRWREGAGGGACAAGATHPVVYVAKGSHASYAGAGATRQCLSSTVPGLRRLCLTDVRERGRAIRAWRTLADVRAQPWYGFGGAWGDWGLVGDTTGPLGPSRYKR